MEPQPIIPEQQQKVIRVKSIWLSLAIKVLVVMAVIALFFLIFYIGA